MHSAAYLIANHGDLGCSGKHRAGNPYAVRIPHKTGVLRENLGQ